MKDVAGGKFMSQKGSSLYHQQPYTRNIQTRIEAMHQLELDGLSRTAVVFRESQFYPRGGGQPGDRGSFEGYPILDTLKGSDIPGFPGDPSSTVHVMELNGKLHPGDQGELGLDWKHRWDYMQQHSGQHLISAAFWLIGSYPTISVHQGSDYTTVEFQAGDIPDNDILRATELANRCIMARLDIRSRQISEEELEKLPLRRSLKVESRIRVLEIGRFSPSGNAELPPILKGLEDARLEPGNSEALLLDVVGCGGVHLRNSAEIRLIHHLKTERIRGRVRLYWKIGDRALEDYRMKEDVCGKTGTMLSRPPEEIPGRVSELQNEISNVRKELGVMKRRQLMSRIDEALFRTPGRRDGSDNLHSAPKISLFLEEGDMNDLRDAVKYLQKLEVQTAVLAAYDHDGSAEGESKIFWCLMDRRDPSLEFGSIKKDILDPMNARGGGKAPVWQGSMPAATPEDGRLLIQRLTAGFSRTPHA